jgi:hypothetical protein
MLFYCCIVSTYAIFIAGWMTETTCTFTINNIKNDVVGFIRSNA